MATARAALLLCAALGAVRASTLPFALGFEPGSYQSAAVYPLVLCNGLNASQQHLRALEVAEHVFPGGLHESECVQINPCTQQNHRGDAVPAGAWVWRNASALWLDGNETAVRGGAPERAYNWQGLEFARVPEGLHVRACEPDFNALRLRGELVCAAGTEVSLDMRAGRAACPSAAPFSLLDCLLSLERRPVVERVPFRAKNVRMAFGSKTWNEACLASAPAEGRELCARLESSYELLLPRATAASRAQLVRYDFSAGFGCFGALDAAVGQRLTRAEHPNRVEACPDTLHATHKAGANPTECDFQCDVGYTKTPSGCALGCVAEDGAQLTHTSCRDGEHARALCATGGVTYFQCVACPEVPGSAVLAWALSPAACTYAACAAGSAGSGNACSPCPPHTHAPHSNMSACLPCDANTSATYQPLPGQSTCTPCFAAAPTATCPPGRARVAAFADIKAYFARTGLHQHEDMTAYCMQGFACLACEPGSSGEGGSSGVDCVPCEVGKYQPNYESTRCFACSHGQSTPRAGATDPAECLCQPGFE